MGVAAHITAASKGGARYDASLTKEERADAENGIWLCNVCSRVVDDAQDSYSVEVLRSMRDRATRYALKEFRSLDEVASAVTSIDEVVELLEAHHRNIDIPHGLQDKAEWLEYRDLLRRGAPALELDSWRNAHTIREMERQSHAAAEMQSNLVIPLQRAAWLSGEILDHESVNVVVLRRTLLLSMHEAFTRADLFHALSAVRSELEYS